MIFELNRLPRGVSDEVIKQEIIRVSELINDAAITRQKFDDISKISSSALIKKFGSWNDALIICGLGNRYSGQPVSSKMKSQIARNLSNIELTNELIRVAKLNDKKELSQSEFNEHSKISASAISRRFGSWSEGLTLAGLSEVKMARRYTELEYYENLLTVWTHYGRQPFYREMDVYPSVISSGGYERKWGKWTTALLAFIDYANSDKPVQEIITITKVSISSNDLKNDLKDKRDISLGLRYKVLNRDRFRCIKCGNSPASDLTCKLHLDHIIPHSKGGLTTFENLQTTCDNCNLGKGNRFND